jgi:hypothetical protein
MNYQKIHDLIINRAKNRTKGFIGEIHHIRPKSLGGDNSTENLVRLSHREHFIIHKILVRLYDGENRFKMICALKRFIGSDVCKLTSKQYESIRLEHAAGCSAALSGRKLSEETKRKQSIAQKKRYSETPTHWNGATHREETKTKISQAQRGDKNHQYGIPRSDEIRKKISESLKGRKKSPETIAKFKQRSMSIESRKKISETARLKRENKEQNI